MKKTFGCVLALALMLTTTALGAGHASFGGGGHSGAVFGHGGGWHGGGWHGGGWHGGHWYGGGFGPGFALGFGFGALATYPWYGWGYYPPYYGYSYYYPAYSYPAYAYSPAPVAAAPARATATAPVQAPAPRVLAARENQSWAPATPGAGTWVPDPEPYSYAPEKPLATHSAQPDVANRKVSFTTSAGGVPVYANSPLASATN